MTSTKVLLVLVAVIYCVAAIETETIAKVHDKIDDSEKKTESQPSLIRKIRQFFGQEEDINIEVDRFGGRPFGGQREEDINIEIVERPQRGHHGFGGGRRGGEVVENINIDIDDYGK